LFIELLRAKNLEINGKYDWLQTKNIKKREEKRKQKEKLKKRKKSNVMNV